MAKIIFAQGLTVSERFEANNNNRAVFGFGFGAHNVRAENPLTPSDINGFGLENLSGRFLNAFQPLNGTELLLGMNLGGMSFGKLFSESAKQNKLSGFYYDFQIGFRYLHPVSDAIDIGGQVFVGYLINLSDIGRSLISDLYDFGWPLHLRVGPAGRVTFDNDLTWYFSLNYTLDRFSKPSSSSANDFNFRPTVLAVANIDKGIFGGTYRHGIELPTGITWALNHKFSLFAEANIHLQDFSAKGLGLLAGLDIGFSIDFFK